MKKILLTSLFSLVFSITSITAQDVTECLEVDSNPAMFSSSICNKFYTVDGSHLVEYEVYLNVEAFSYSGLSDKTYDIEARVYNSDLPSFSTSINDSEISSGNSHRKSVNELVYANYISNSEIGDFHVYSSWTVDNDPPDYVHAEAYLYVEWALILGKGN